MALREDDYYAVAPDGRKLKISKALFAALDDFHTKHRTGRLDVSMADGESIEVDIRTGGIAGVRGTVSYQ